MRILCIHVLIRDEKEGSKQGHSNNKAKQHSTPKAVTFPKKNELDDTQIREAFQIFGTRISISHHTRTQQTVVCKDGFP